MKTHLKETNRRAIFNSGLRNYVESILKRHVYEHDAICLKCRTRIQREIQANKLVNNVTVAEKNKSNEKKQASSGGVLSPKTIQLPICSTTKSHRMCIVCKKQNSNRHKLIVVPNEAKTQTFIDKGIFISTNSRCCSDHLVGKYFKQEALKALKHTSSSTFFNRTDVNNLLDRTRSMLKDVGKLNFDVQIAMSDDDFVNLTGLTKQQFDVVATHVTDLRNSEVRSIRTCLAILLVKLCTGLSNTILGTLFSLKSYNIRRAVHSARESLIKNFVPSFLGFNHMSHSVFAQSHTTPTAKTLFTGNNEDTAVLILDGTYIYIQKSSYHKFQKKTYSMHKNRPLVKPMIIVGSDGYILSVLGPYYANGHNNDASITKHLFKTNAEDIKKWIKDDDVLVVDRGFRDAQTFLESLNLKVEMPCFIKKGQKQHTTEEANSSRLITKVRWVVESANGRIKQWRFLDKVVSNHFVPYIGDFVRIVSAFINCFRAPLINDFCNEEIGQTMLDKAQLGNQVQKYVEDNNLIRKKAIYSEVNGTENVLDFPKLTLQQIRDITMGVYQLKQAPRYTESHLSDDNYMLQTCRDRPNLLRVKLTSRHSSSRVYSLWIEFSGDEVTGWYCTCKVGARVVGCCAHIASTMWYLGYSRWELETPSTCKYADSILNAKDVPLETDSDSDSDGFIEE
ncbi:uncharacterized protein LOC143044399 [Mytilus galloprovincialis]|uniref:uncharacterized protein LOC143044399 n=1 Tax=Mytilus galloprovincialis TaxID=29158 RepID=UPI003F7C5342